MTEAEARKILINKSLTGAFTNEECDALSVLFREVEQLQGARNKTIDDVFEFLKSKRDKRHMKICFDDLEIRDYKKQMKGE